MIVQDQYGPRVAVGGGAFSGKDATKVDRSGAYYARKLAREIVLEGVSEATVYIDWAIGEASPIGSNYGIPIPSVKEIIKELDLRKPVFYERTKRGHFGFDSF